MMGLRFTVSLLLLVMTLTLLLTFVILIDPGRANQDATKAPLLAKHAAKMNPGAANPEILPALACQQYGSKTKLSFPESLLEGIAEEFLEDILKGKL
jgi:hypothetical protein